MTQADLARKLKKSRASVNEWESGKHVPRMKVLTAISRLLDTSLEELFA